MSQTTLLTLHNFHGSQSGRISLRAPSTREVTPTEVAIKITHSGICFTDDHNRGRDEYGLGHEGVGLVTQIGSAVKGLKIGDRVGAGCAAILFANQKKGKTNALLDTFMDGYHQYCKKSQSFAFSNLDQGTFGNIAIREELEAYKIPDGIESKYAGPFLCAGPIVYQALLTAKLQPNATVGIVGVVGLGHLAIQFAKAMGYSVIVYSSTNSKREDAMKLGADEFYTTKGIETLVLPGIAKGKRDGINALIFTTNEVPDLKAYMGILAPQAWIMPMTVQVKDLVVPFLPFLAGGHKLTMGAGAARQNVIVMLDFAAKHNIRPWIEEFPLTEKGLNEAFDRLEAGKMRYRGIAVVQ